MANFGHNGAAVMFGTKNAYRAAPELKQALKFKPHVIIVQIGTFDAIPSNWELGKMKSGARFRFELGRIVSSFRYLKTRPSVFVALPPAVLGTNKLGVSSKILRNELLPQLKDAAKEFGFSVVLDLQKVVEPSDYLADGVHFNSDGAQRIAKVGIQHPFYTARGLCFCLHSHSQDTWGYVFLFGVCVQEWASAFDACVTHHE